MLLFVFRRYDIGIDYIAIWHIFFTGVLMAAIFNCHHTQTVKNIALILGLPTVILNWWGLFAPTYVLFLSGLFASLIFLIFAVFSLLNRVILGKVTADVLRGTVCLYFMIGFSFSLIYTLMEIIYPGSFIGLRGIIQDFPIPNYHSEMVYFSFITLLAIGFGDITPAGDLGQMFVVSEGVIGQFYLAIIVARMVGAYARRQIKSIK